MTDRPLPPALTGTDMRLDRLIDLQREVITYQRQHEEWLRRITYLLTPAVPVETDQIELREPVETPKPRAKKP